MSRNSEKVYNFEIFMLDFVKVYTNLWEVKVYQITTKREPKKLLVEWYNMI